MLRGKWLALATAVLTTASASALTQQRDALAAAAVALQAGDAAHALEWLGQADQQRAETHNLNCRVQYVLEHWDQAASECERAVQMDGGNSSYHMWLGRALGEKADRASFVSAYSLGKRVREEFERAAQLDPRNAEALADLGEFYYSAPGVVGGGMDKAEHIAAQLDPIDAVRAHELRAHMAEQRKDYGTAEREFKQALSASMHPAFQWMTLGSFYRRRQLWNEMESAIRSGAQAAERDHHAAVALYNGAITLIRSNRDQALAAKLLETYLASSVKTEEAPAFAAHVQLARLKLQMGDVATAGRERAAALALAPSYKPAQEIRH